jgi:hypothetical protein
VFLAEITQTTNLEEASRFSTVSFEQDDIEEFIFWVESR